MINPIASPAHSRDVMDGLERFPNRAWAGYKPALTQAENSIHGWELSPAGIISLYAMNFAVGVDRIHPRHVRGYYKWT